jgi:hypothetical protein
MRLSLDQARNLSQKAACEILDGVELEHGYMPRRVRLHALDDIWPEIETIIHRYEFVDA